jgi:4-amino-4-deoxy-L-arabinose transferase-like glycosyltransferase
MAGRWVWVAAVALVAAALALRIAYVDATPGYSARHDARDYDVHARSIAEGQGFSKTLAYGRATAFRPPGYPYFLGGVYRVFGVERAPAPRRYRVARIAQAFVGAAVVALVGVVAAQLWGPIVALIALALTAVYVPLITVGGAIMSEPLFDLFMLASLVAALAYRRSPHRYRWALLAGVLGGLATLTRANAMILLLPLAVAVWDGRPWRSRAAIGPPLALLVAAALTIAPWTIRNAVELHAFVPVSTQFGSALAGTYNDAARADTQNPAAWQGIKHVPEYGDLFRRIRQIPEAQLDHELRASSERYIRAHPLYVAKVAWWNTRRMLDLAGQRRSRATASTITIDHTWADRGVLCFWIVTALALAGALAGAARRTPWWVWAFPVLMFLSVVVLVVETPRYRTPIDPFLVLLAAAGIALAAQSVIRMTYHGRRAPERPASTRPLPADRLGPVGEPVRPGSGAARRG